MELEQFYQATQEELPKARWEHSLRVVETAINLAKRVGLSPERAEIAGVLHDYCKYWPEEKLLQWMRKGNYPEEYLQYNKVWHAFVGAEVARSHFFIQDEEIVNAIRFHTSGRPGMSLLEKVIYIADYIEPGRSFAGVDEVRELAEENVDHALLKALDNTIITLIRRKQNVFPLTLQARNDILNQVSTQTKGESI